VVGEGRCPIVDTWWQTETGAIMITPLPGAYHRSRWRGRAPVCEWFRKGLQGCTL